jgi:hypothetical protein
MFNVRIGFAPGTRVRADVHAVRRTNLHAHSNALEIVYVLHGALHVVVSSEAFDLDAGDYAVLNRSDPHLLEGSADNVTAVLHFDLSSFVDSAVTPCLVLEYSGRDATSALISTRSRANSEASVPMRWPCGLSTAGHMHARPSTSSSTLPATNTG